MPLKQIKQGKQRLSKFTDCPPEFLGDLGQGYGNWVGREECGLQKVEE